MPKSAPLSRRGKAMSGQPASSLPGRELQRRETLAMLAVMAISGGAPVSAIALPTTPVIAAPEVVPAPLLLSL